MVDQHTVSTFSIPNGFGISETLVRDVTPNPGNDPCRSGSDLNAALHFDKVFQPKIGPVMAVVG
jgi:hypothetical protein